jgi:hypothetical protein
LHACIPVAVRLCGEQNKACRVKHKSNTNK